MWTGGNSGTKEDRRSFYGTKEDGKSFSGTKEDMTSMSGNGGGGYNVDSWKDYSRQGKSH